MKRIGTFFLLLSLAWLSAACDDLIMPKEEEAPDDPAFAESVIGLWYVDFLQAVAVDLREDRTYVSSRYIQAGAMPSPTTYYSDSWKATEMNVGPFFREGDKLTMKVTTGEYIEAKRIFDPRTGSSTVSLPRLTGEVWTGYYKDKIITLEFFKDGTARRVDKPNAGWEGEEETRTYTWKTSGRVCRLNGDEAWCVGLPYDMVFTASKEIEMIFVDFGDAASAFVNFTGTIDDL